MTDELVEFLLACIAEDERRARASTPGPWRYSPNKHYRWPGSVNFEDGVFAGQSGKAAVSVARTGPSDDPQSMADAEHIAAWDPARVLAECESKRRLIRLAVDDLLPNTLMGEATDEYGWTVLELLLLPFSGHRDYRQEWTP